VTQIRAVFNLGFLTPGYILTTEADIQSRVKYNKDITDSEL